jgi:hypothetical protein
MNFLLDLLKRKKPIYSEISEPKKINKLKIIPQKKYDDDELKINIFKCKKINKIE